MKQYSITPAWANTLEEWVLSLRAAGRSPQTIETRTEHLRRFSRQTKVGAPALVTATHVERWAGQNEWSRETRRSTYASLRAFFTWAHESGLIDSNPAETLPTVQPGPAVPRPANERAYREALSIADARAHVVLRLAAEAGLRRAEIAQVSASDLIEDIAGLTLVVHGKGGKVRMVPLSDSLGREVVTYLGHRRWLLPSPAGTHLTARHVAKIARQYLPADVTLHMLRHRFATVVNRQTHDLLAVQRLLGHSSVATTQRYCAIDTDVLRSAVDTAAV